MKRAWQRLGRAIARLWAGWSSADIFTLGLLAALIGLATGIGVWLFKQLIEIVRQAAFGDLGSLLASLGRWTVGIMPVLGGLVVGFVLVRLAGERHHPGVAGVMEAVAVAGGRLETRLTPLRTLAASLSIGSGASVGPEDPSVQIGANLGSYLAQKLRFSDERMRSLVAAGAAAGVSAAFNAPIAGIFFSLEVVLGELTSQAFGIVVLAAVVSAVFTQAVSGAQPAFHVVPYAFNSALELPFYLVLGLLAGPVAALYIRAIYASRDFFASLRLPDWLKPAAAGLAVGVVGVFLPQVFGVGYETITRLLAGEQLPLLVLFLILAAKLLLTAISLGGGFPGGVIAPSLFLGALLGTAYGQAVDALIPTLHLDPPAFAMVAMAAVLAGAINAPITAILLLFEMTNDYRIILPLMAAVVVGLVVARRLQPDSIYAVALARKGLRLERGLDVEVLQGITTGEVMEQNPPVIRVDDPVSLASEMLARTHRHGLVVLDRLGRLAGILTLMDLERLASAGETATAGQVCTREVVTVFPDESIGSALRRMASRDIGRLPVVSRQDPAHLVGLLRREDIIRSYDLALARRAAARHRLQQARLGAISRMQVEELVVETGAACAGKTVAEVAWPKEVVIASIRRGSQMLVPHGDTVLQPGDALVTVSELAFNPALHSLCAAPEPDGGGSFE